MGRLAVAFALVLMFPALAGCVTESLEVALRVGPGRTLVLDGARTVDGSILVEEGGHLVLRGADLTIAQALVVEPGGRVSGADSDVRFVGRFVRQDIQNQGRLEFERVTVTGLRHLYAYGGEALVRGGSVEARSVEAAGGALLSEDAAWRLREVGNNLQVNLMALQGRLEFEGGSIDASGRHALRAMGGSTQLANLTLDLATTGTALVMDGGQALLYNVGLRQSGGGRVVEAHRGTIRLHDTPLPDASQPFHVGSGRVEIAWTLTVRAVSPPGDIPVGGVNVTLRSAHAPADVSDQNVTDENGETRLTALQMVVGRESSRSGNPFLLQASGGGKQGAMSGIVVDGPTTVTVPVFG